MDCVICQATIPTGLYVCICDECQNKLNKVKDDLDSRLSDRMSPFD